MVTPQGKLLVECSGPSCGTVSSFRAEAYGALVIARFSEQYDYEYDYSHNTLQPDWDVIAQLTSNARK
eukprot:14375659-Ditylum_brightwellii.AAC.1